MDVSALSETTFSPAEWINANYKKFVEENGRDDSEAASAFIRSYVAKLQLYIFNVSGAAHPWIFCKHYRFPGKQCCGGVKSASGGQHAKDR